MANITNETLKKIKDLQGGIWPSVANTVSESVDNLVNLNYENTEVADTLALTPLTSEPCIMMKFDFAEAKGNTSFILLPEQVFLSLVSLITDEEVAAYDESHMVQMKPAMESFLSGLETAVSNTLGVDVHIHDKEFEYGTLVLPQTITSENESVKIEVSYSSGASEGTIYWLMDSVVSAMLSGEESHGANTGDKVAMGKKNDVSSEDNSSPMAQSKEVAKSIPETRGDTFSSSPKTSSLDVLMDVSLDFSVELGRIKLPVRDVIDLGVGSIVEIDKAAGEPVDVMVNGSLVAQGEVVVVEDNFAVRITEILSPKERLYKLSGKS